MSPEEADDQFDNGTVNCTVDAQRQRFPFCIVWTPLPLISMVFPFIGHMGIATSTGVIRDFAGPYSVNEDNLAFGRTTKYWQLDYRKCKAGVKGWDLAVQEASDVYKTRMHNIFCDNCHSHVAMALNLMNYDNSSKWNMFKVATLMLIHGRYVSFYAFCKTWGPFLAIVVVIYLIYVFT